MDIEQVAEQCQNTFPSTELPHEDHTDHASGDMPEDLVIPTIEGALPEKLSETPLYSDISTKEVHSALLPYSPAHPFWSDGLDKKRWVYIPECEKIDTFDMNDWSFPVGTRFFKEFYVEGRRVETRLIERLGEGPRDFAYASYMWNDDESEAIRVSSEGVPNAQGTQHDIPSKQQCLQCHGTYSFGGGRPSRGLGFSAIQLGNAVEGTTLNDLIEQDRLTITPNIEAVSIPGNATEKAALGYLHANCGGCHNKSNDGLPHTDLSFWIDVGLASVEETDTYLTAVGQTTKLFKDQHVTGRVVPGEPNESAVFYRMNQRGNNAQMPPVATKIQDDDGLILIQDWIEGL